MEIETFINNIKDQFIDPDFENQQITLDINTEFKKIDSYDSLTAMTIVVMLKDEYNVEISEEEYRSMKTVQDLYNFVSSKI